MTVNRHPSTGSAVTVKQWRYTATGGETTLSGTDGFSQSLAYTVGAEEVYVNGVLLERAVDYTATTGTSVVLTNALVAGDIATVMSANAFNVANAIPNSTVTAKGDLIVGNGAASVTNLGVGADGSTLVANSSAGGGVSWAGPIATAGKNKIINGDFSIWQRGTTVVTNAGYGYPSDRYFGYSAGSQSWTKTTDAPTNVGLTYCISNSTLVASWVIGQMIELAATGVSQFTSPNWTFSFYGKFDNGRTINIIAHYADDTSGTNNSSNLISTSVTGTGSWQRYTVTTTLGSSVSPNGTNKGLRVVIYDLSGTSSTTVRTTGWQFEQGSVVTPFTTATGTLQGELAACQRYLPVYSGGALSGYAYGTNSTLYAFKFPVTARVAPTSITVVSNPNMYALNTATNAAPTLDLTAIDGADLLGSITIVAGQGSRMMGGTILFNGCEL